MGKKVSEKTNISGPQSSSEQPLKGRTVMVTRPQDQSKEITSMLERLGATVIHCPTIQVIEPDDWASVDEAIDRLETYDWLVFTSSNGVEFFFRRLTERRRDWTDRVADLITFAIGPATARAIEAKGARVDLVAGDSKAEGAIRAIIEYLGGEEQLRGLRFLAPQSRIAREVLPVELRKLGASVDAIVTYQTVKPDLDGESLAQLFRDGRIDAVTFTSPSTVSNFAALVGAKDLSAFFENVAVACIGPVTSEAASGLGIKGIIQPETYNSVALVEALVKAIGNR